VIAIGGPPERIPEEDGDSSCRYGRGSAPIRPIWVLTASSSAEPSGSRRLESSWPCVIALVTCANGRERQRRGRGAGFESP